MIPKTRNNHYVPQWYQKGFLKENKKNSLIYRNIHPDKKELTNGKIITFNDKSNEPTSNCFYQTDLYTTIFGNYINDDVEKFLFGKIDDFGSRAVRAFIDTDPRGWHQHFSNFFTYIDAQKLRTPKGLDWIRFQYPDICQVELMVEMQSIRNLNCTLWAEGIREIVSAKKSDVKFLISDHPVTVYNYACPPNDELCLYPNDPSIALNASQTIFPLDKDHCLILTNLDYAKSYDSVDPIKKRPHSKLMRQSLARTDKFIRSRELGRDEVIAINYILKSRARRYIASVDKDTLYPEEHCTLKWDELREILRPPSRELFHFGGDVYVGYEDGTTYHQDAYGREYPENENLKKTPLSEKLGRNDPCGCGSGKKFKKCCAGTPPKNRPSWDVLSIRERNGVLYRGIYDILGFNDGKNWNDVRRELSNEQIVRIHQLYWTLWPIETDIFSLLPRPDETLRTIYTGVLDPRTIFIPLAVAPFFDEVIIQHPFVHPKAVKPKFSPIENPHQHKYQTLKNLLFFLSLEPFIQSGIVNFIPDPCVFDNHLQHQMMHMAEARRGDVEIDQKEKDRMMELGKDDFARTMRGGAEEQLKKMCAKSSQKLSAKDIDDVVRYMKSLNENDPLALLQDDLFEQGGQLMTHCMAPNFEMALFMAQATGSAILTDSKARWGELAMAQSNNLGFVTYPYKKIQDLIASKDFIFNADPSESFNLCKKNNYGQLKSIFREIINKAKDGDLHIESSIQNRYEHDFQKGCELFENSINPDDKNLFRGKLNFLLPEGGFVHNNSQRLLIMSGSEHHISSVPAAILFEPPNW